MRVIASYLIVAAFVIILSGCKIVSNETRLKTDSQTFNVETISQQASNEENKKDIYNDIDEINNMLSGLSETMKKPISQEDTEELFKSILKPTKEQFVEVEQITDKGNYIIRYSSVIMFDKEEEEGMAELINRYEFDPKTARVISIVQ